MTAYEETSATLRWTNHDLQHFVFFKKYSELQNKTDNIGRCTWGNAAVWGDNKNVIVQCGWNRTFCLILNKLRLQHGGVYVVGNAKGKIDANQSLLIILGKLLIYISYLVIIIIFIIIISYYILLIS